MFLQASVHCHADCKARFRGCACLDGQVTRLPSQGKELPGGGMLVLQLSLWPRTIGGRRGAESEAEESLRCRSHVWSRNAVSGEEAEE